MARNIVARGLQTKQPTIVAFQSEMSEKLCLTRLADAHVFGIWKCGLWLHEESIFLSGRIDWLKIGFMLC